MSTVAVIPCYNHPATIGTMVAGVRAEGLSCIVVDDGSHTACAAVLDTKGPHIATLAAEITARLAIPVIGIGAGPATDAQVLVMHDLLGLSPRPPRFAPRGLPSSA